MSTIEPPHPVESTAEPPASGAEHPVEIRRLHDAEDMVAVRDVLQRVWGSGTEIVPIELLTAIGHAGGYVSAAYDVGGEHERVLGASVGFLARHAGRPALHSHITGVLPGAQASGIGRAMKLHQYRWAAGHGIERIVWTYDPLVRRNAWFNIAVLGAEIHDYLPSFYGSMRDAINAGDETDRLLAVWSVDPGGEPADRLCDGRGVVASTTIATPDDVVALRRSDPSAAARWRRETRDAFTAALARGERVAGFTRGGEYLLVEAPR